MAKQKRKCEYTQWHEGKPYTHDVRLPLHIACCSCSLTHKWLFKIKDKYHIILTPYLAPRDTKILRNLKKGS